MLYSSDTVSTVSTHFGKLLKGNSLADENKKQFSLVKLEIKNLIEAIHIEQQIEAMETHLYVLEHQLEDRLAILEQTATTIAPDSTFAAKQTAALEAEREQINNQYIVKIAELREQLNVEQDKLENIKSRTRRKIGGFLHQHQIITDEVTDKLITVVNDALLDSGLPTLNADQKQKLIDMIHNESSDALMEQCRLMSQHPDQTNEKEKKALQKEMENLMKKQIEKFVNFVLQQQEAGRR